MHELVKSVQNYRKFVENSKSMYHQDSILGRVYFLAQVGREGTLDGTINKSLIKGKKPRVAFQSQQPNITYPFAVFLTFKK